MLARLALLVTVLVAALSHLPAAPARSSSAGDEDRPLARGAIDLFGEPMAWRIAQVNTNVTAIADGGAPDPAGFALVERGSAGISGLGFGSRSIGQGEALFLPDRHSADVAGSPESRLILLLLARDGEKSGRGGLRGDWPLHVGVPFSPPAGPYDLRLTRIELAAGERGNLPPSPWPIAVVATSGGTALRPADAPPSLLSAGHATTVAGGAAIEAGRDGAVLHLASLVPQEPPASWAGSLALRLQSCPPQIQPPLPAGLACGPPDAMPDVQLRERGGHTVLGLSAARRSGDLLIWDWLGPGEYLLSVRNLPLGTRRFVVPGFAGTIAIPELGFDPGRRNGALVSVSAGEVRPVSVYLVERPPAHPFMDIAVRVFECPADMPFPPDDAHRCLPTDPPNGLRLSFHDEGRIEKTVPVTPQARNGGWIVPRVKPGPWLLTADLPASYSDWTARTSDPALPAVPLAADAVLLGVNPGWNPDAEATLSVYLRPAT